MESKYNPEIEADRKIQNQIINSKIVLLIGIGSGIYLNKLAKHYSYVEFIGVEYSESDINFLNNFEYFKELNDLRNVKIIHVNEIKNTLLQTYLPAMYGNLQIIEQRPWIDEIKTEYSKIKTQIEEALKLIKADFSVQAHFGKIWQKNIQNNLKILKEQKNNFVLKAETSKEAVIVAAGPSLDSTISILKNNSEKYIISTDTAFQTLLKNKIVPEIVVSIDGQNISYEHFYNIPTEIKTLFVFDICGNSKAAEKIYQKNKQLFFINNGHPFINEINYFNLNKIPYISAGSGTVTIAAFDLAAQMGFRKIKIIGADFGYLKGKPYAKGTYLDSIYNRNSNLFNSTEKQFNFLQYRTELKIIYPEYKTTELLESYRQSFENYLKANNCSFNKNNFVYSVDIKKNNSNLLIKTQQIDSEKYINQLKIAIKNIKDDDFIDLTFLQKNYLTGLLPLISFYRNKKQYSDFTIQKLLKLALKNIVRYN